MGTCMYMIFFRKKNERKRAIVVILLGLDHNKPFIYFYFFEKG